MIGQEEMASNFAKGGLDIRYLEKFFHKEVCQASEKAAPKLLRKAQELSSVAVFKRYIDLTHGNMVQWWTWQS